jgi:2-C-methyl-D-erythritol 4-phosphate cytidylyltransferase
VVGCAPIVVVVPAGSQQRARTLAARDANVVVVPGGESRRQSVARGLQHVFTSAVVVHDAARPFVTPGAIEAVVRALDDAEGAITGLPVDETLKRIDDGRVRETVDRSTLWSVQTPQAFHTEALREAHRRAQADGFDATDDAQLFERYGGSVVVVRGSRDNLKLTYPEDFAVAEAMIRARS